MKNKNIELHKHFTGSLPRSFIEGIVKKKIKITKNSLKTLNSSFEEIIKDFYKKATLRDIENGAFLISQNAIDNNIIYQEIRFSLKRNTLFRNQEYIDAIVRGSKSVLTNIIIGINTKDLQDIFFIENELKHILLNSKFKNKIKGIDIAGDEEILCDNKKNLLLLKDIARTLHLKTTIHNGEIVYKNMKNCNMFIAEKFNPNRIGHGYYNIFIKNKCVEFCPFSARYISSFNRDTILRNKKNKITVSTDDMLYFNKDIVYNKVLYNILLGNPDNLLLFNSFVCSFTSTSDKMYLLTKIFSDYV